MNNPNWIDHLRQMENDYEAKVPEGLFDDIMKQLPKQQKHEQKATLWSLLSAKKSTFNIQHSKLISIVAAAIIIMLIALPQLHKTSTESIQKPQMLSTTTKPTDIKRPTTTQSEEHLGLVASVVGRIRHAAETISDEIPAESEPQEAVNIASVGNNEIAENISSTEEKASTEKASSTKATVPTKTLEMPTTYLAENRTRKRPAITTSLFAQGIATSTDFGDSEMAFNSVNYYGEDVTDDTEGETTSTQKPHKAKKTTEASQQEASHDIPLRFGLTVAVPLNDKFSIETGLVYTRLSSDISSILGPDYSTYKQTLHYIGVPLKLNYTLWQSKRASIYAKGGMMAEKLVGSNIEMQSDAVSPSRPKESAPQFSVSLAAGAALDIIQQLQIFIEPGVSHYFDNGSSICNIYKDRPTSFDLSLGLRFRIGK